MNPNNVARYTTPMSPDSSHRGTEEPPPVEPLSPESIVSRPSSPRLYRFEWAIDPHDPTKHLSPPEVVIRNCLFAVEFRISSPEDFKPEVNFYARVLPKYSKAFHLGRERVTTNKWERTVLFIPREGVYGIDVRIIPDCPGYLTGLVKHRYLTTVFDEGDGVRAPLGALEHRVLFGDDQGQVQNMESTAKSNGQWEMEDIKSQANADVSKMDDFFTEWLGFSPEP
ncbi:hypothetical protein PMAA_055400 [Talaromyces marneffei ATCC 18224]|uniref:Uncharacterized protein n=2 Tax=Talaromyces marneffei TaxID=37727 RepID=B6QKW6_TALMQ|nr:hypothetical protein PMAA_055400 [Talaromyces marneffei ATCC 18224]